MSARISAFSGKKLKEAREAKGWTQGKLAVRGTVALSSIAAWESGSRAPEARTIAKLAKTLGMNAGELLTIPKDAYTLTEYRIVAGLTQRDVAKELGVQAPRIGHYEMAYTPLDSATVQLLADLYSATPDEITAAWRRARTELEADES
jgi:transcriptional regulator with XRE-family HTH domain